MPSNPKRVCLVTARVGSGHVQAARALAESLEARGVAHETLDTMQLVPRVFRALYAGGYATMVSRMPTVFGVLYDRFDQPARPSLDRTRIWLEGKLLRRLWRRLLADPPEWIVHTHFLAPAATANWIARTGVRTRQAVVITDTYPHRIWLAPRVEHFFVATKSARECLIGDGVAPAKITISGIPITAKHRVTVDADRVRREFGWPEDRPVLLVMAGSDFVVGPIERVIDSLARHFPQAIIHVGAGKNKKLARRLEAQHAGRENVRIMGFTERMPELLAAATVVISKPGGLTVSETLAAGAAMICLYPVPGQEMTNADYLLERGAGLKVVRLRELIPTVRRVLEEPGLLESLRSGSRRLARPDAADVIIDAVLRA